MSAPVIVELDDPDLRRVVDGGRHVGVGQFDDFVEASDFESGNRPERDCHHKQSTKENFHFQNLYKKTI